MTNIIPFEQICLYSEQFAKSKEEKRKAVINALIRFIVAMDNSNGIVSTLPDITARAEYIYKRRIKSYRDLKRFYNNLKKAGA